MTERMIPVFQGPGFLLAFPNQGVAKMAKGNKRVVRVAVVTVNQETKKDVRAFVQNCLDNGIKGLEHKIASAKATAVDED